MDQTQRISRIESGLPPYRPGNLIIPVGEEKSTLQAEMTRMHIPGVSVAVINDMEIIWAKGYGLLEADTNRAVGVDSLFQACSISKMITASLVMKLIERSLLDLDEDVDRYLRNWHFPESEYTRDRKVTLRLLLSHQSGINRPDGGFDWEPGTKPTLLNILNGEPPAIIEAAKIECTPGSKWQYANFGYIVIQQIIEDVLGEPFEERAQSEIFDVLQMRDSTFKYPLSNEWAVREIMLHDGEGKTTEPGIIPSAVAHAGLFTTTSDLAQFGIALMNTYHGVSEALFTRSTLDKMFEQQTWIEDPSELGFPFGMGLGVFMVGEGKNKAFFHPGGNDPGASSLLVIFPERKCGAAIMTNGIKGLVFSAQVLASIAHEYVWQQ